MKKRAFALLSALLFLIPSLCAATVDAASMRSGLVIDCVGDSITWGSGSTNKIDGKRNESKNYEGVLRTLIGNGCTIYNDSKPGASMLNDLAKNSVSTGGYTSVREICASFDRTDLDIVLFMMGTNDSKITAYDDIGVYKPGIWDQPYGDPTTKTTPAQEFALRYRAAIDHYFQMASHPFVYCLIPPPALSEDYAPNYRITDANMTKVGGINDMIRKVVYDCQKEGLPVALIDIRAAFPDPNSDPTGLKARLADGVHPNQTGYRLIANTIYNKLSDTFAATETPAKSQTSPERSDSTADPAPKLSRIRYVFAKEDLEMPDDKTEYAAGSSAAAAAPDRILKDGYSFLGWSATENGTVLYRPGDSIPISGEDITLYPVFSRDTVYHIRYHFPEGFDSVCEDENAYRLGDRVKLKNSSDFVYDSDSFTFLGWSTVENGEIISYSETDLEGDLDLYAVFAPAFPQSEPDVPEPAQEEAQASAPAFPLWGWCMIGAGVLTLGALLAFLLIRRKKKLSAPETAADATTHEADSQ